MNASVSKPAATKSVSSPKPYYTPDPHDVSAPNEKKWNPTPEQFEAYREREIVLARRNIAHLTHRYFDDFDFGDTLHSYETFAAARKTP